MPSRRPPFGSPRGARSAKHRVAVGGTKATSSRPGCDLPFVPRLLTGHRRYKAPARASDTQGFLSLERPGQAEETGEVFEDVAIEPARSFIEIVTSTRKAVPPASTCARPSRRRPPYGDRLTGGSRSSDCGRIMRTKPSRRNAADDAQHNEVVFDNNDPTSEELMSRAKRLK